MLAKSHALSTLLCITALAPLSAHALANTFQFYGNGPLADEVTSAPTFINGSLAVTIRAYDDTGKLLSLAKRVDGLGAYGGGLDSSNIDSLFSGPAESLELTFNKAVKLNALGFSLWDNGLLGPIDQATLAWGNQSLTLGTNNDHGLLVKTFSWPGAETPVGTVFKITSSGSLSSFRLAGIGATAVPEPATLLLMGLGLAGVAFTAGRSSQRTKA